MAREKKRKRAASAPRGGKRARAPKRPRKKVRAPAPAKKPKKRRRGHLPPKKRPDWRSPSSRRSVLESLRKVAGSLAERLKRVALFDAEAVYLRGIASLAKGKRVTPAQALALLSAMRQGSPLFRSVFGKKEERLVQGFQDRQNELARKRPGGLATDFLLARYENAGKLIFYRSRSGVTQVWSREGFLRFIQNPVYKLRRKGVFSGGTFWIAKPERRGGRPSLPKRGRIKFPVGKG